MTGAKAALAWLSAHWAHVVEGTVYLVAVAFILAWIGSWGYEGWRRYHIVRGHREAQRQLRAMEGGKAERTRMRVVSERRKDAA